ncbi:MAG TPA: hypothetical protein VII67_08300 [Acidimicrobiales bacterium]
MKSSASWPVRVLKGFAMFWWDFLVGDTPELFVAALFIVGVVAIVSVSAHENAASVVVLPVLVIAALGLSVLRGVRASKRG